MSDFIGHLIPLKQSMRTHVFEVVSEVLAAIKVLRHTYREQSTNEMWRKGCPRVVISDCNLAVINMAFSVGDEQRELSIWFDYQDHDREDVISNIYLHIGNWGKSAEIFDSVKYAIQKLD